MLPQPAHTAARLREPWRLSRSRRGRAGRRRYGKAIPLLSAKVLSVLGAPADFRRLRIRRPKAAHSPRLEHFYARVDRWKGTTRLGHPSCPGARARCVPDRGSSGVPERAAVVRACVPAGHRRAPQPPRQSRSQADRARLPRPILSLEPDRVRERDNEDGNTDGGENGPSCLPYTVTTAAQQRVLPCSQARQAAEPPGGKRRARCPDLRTGRIRGTRQRAATSGADKSPQTRLQVIVPVAA